MLRRPVATASPWGHTTLRRGASDVSHERHVSSDTLLGSLAFALHVADQVGPCAVVPKGFPGERMPIVDAHVFCYNGPGRGLVTRESPHQPQGQSTITLTLRGST